eukprot:CAMPEP_0202700146 /NCGR_PEP_ID=MMETSP1385-20130828/13360_1 /ASSEMBLY_ACC=CAM_ASM_000861 /TAXON_ID=933848 /ORGANISM="Elphidium margaritaceum" /LENGTH=30 /DNA_ID= /DNA_START= /DNA_END= /DNA_ORIENTATION=
MTPRGCMIQGRRAIMHLFDVGAVIEQFFDH